MSADLPAAFLEFLQTVRGRRSRVVIDHLLAHGSITTRDLETYGYKHPPRAIRDVREQGVPLIKFNLKAADGKTIAAYRFDVDKLDTAVNLGKRRQIPKLIKTALIAAEGARCAVCAQVFPPVQLQVDHRIPYIVASDAQLPRQTNDYMLVCGSCNRAKSWSCEHCVNGQTQKSQAVCGACYWANPVTYQHVALREVRRLDLTWAEDDVLIYEQLQRFADQAHETLPDYVKRILKQRIDLT
jgi:hypothetical protein